MYCKMQNKLKIKVNEVLQIGTKVFQDLLKMFSKRISNLINYASLKENKQFKLNLKLEFKIFYSYKIIVLLKFYEKMKGQ